MILRLDWVVGGGGIEDRTLAILEMVSHETMLNEIHKFRVAYTIVTLNAS